MSIECKKISIKDLFNQMWFNIPEYQRPYVWAEEQISELLEDTIYSLLKNKDEEYFLGSLVLQTKEAAVNGVAYLESDVLDGQQRLTTLILLFSVLRDLIKKPQAKQTCQKCIVQIENTIDGTPKRARLSFAVRGGAENLLEQIAQNDGITIDGDTLKNNCIDPSISVTHMLNAVKFIREYFKDPERTKIDLEAYLGFLIQKVHLISVATVNLDDAFKLFTILNNRGIPLQGSDILKSINLSKITPDTDKKKFSEKWEEMESEHGEEFERFLNHIRTIVLKDKSRASLLKEFQERIYNTANPLLKEGRPTFDFIAKISSIYRNIYSGNNHDPITGYQFDNLVGVMENGFQSSDWVSALLSFVERFGKENQYPFLKLLDKKVAGDLITGRSPSERIESVNTILKKIAVSKTDEELFSQDCFQVDLNIFKQRIEEPIYKKRFAKYVLLKLDFKCANHDHKMNFSKISIEHILPQNPEPNSIWNRDFNTFEKETLLHKLGNLVLITSKKNSSLGRMSFEDKKRYYFKTSIDTCQNTLRVLHDYTIWTPEMLMQNHNDCVAAVLKSYQFNPGE